MNTGADGWMYDNTVYTLTFTVTLEDGWGPAILIFTGCGTSPSFSG